MVVVVVDKAQLGDAAGLTGPGVDRVKKAGRGGGGILRVGRQHQHAGYAFGLERVQLRGDRRAAVAHGPTHQHFFALFAQPAL